MFFSLLSFLLHSNRSRSLFHLVDSSYIYPPRIIAVLVVYRNNQCIKIRSRVLAQSLSSAIIIMSARQPFRPTPRPDSQLPSSQSDSKVFHRTDTDLANAANKSFNLTGLFNQKKRDHTLPARKSKSHDDHQVPHQSASNNSWSASSHTSKLDLSPAPSPVHSSTASGLDSVSTYQCSGMPSAQVENVPSSPIVDNENITSSFFHQEANPQHLLPMINEVDEDLEIVNDSTIGSASLFFTGRYTDSSNSRKRTQRVDEDVDNIENINAKRFKSEQVGTQDAVPCHQ